MSAIPGYKKVIRIWITDAFLASILSGEALANAKAALSTAGLAPAIGDTPAGGKWIPIPTESASLNVSGDLIDDTEMASNNGYRSRIYGLLDWSLSLTFNVEESDANAEDAQKQKRAIKSLLLAAKLSRMPMWVQYLPNVKDFKDIATINDNDLMPNGVTDADIMIGLEGSCVIESWATEGEVSGKESITCPLQGNSKLFPAQKTIPLFTR